LNARIALKFRVDLETGGHVRVQCFVGTDLDHLALSGTLTFRQDEWPAVRSRLGRLADVNALVIVEGRRPEPPTVERVMDVAITHLEHAERVPGCALCAVSVAELV
jgi:hypothetical protein